MDKYNMRMRFCVSMKWLDIGWSSKNRNMDDLCIAIYDANKHCMISEQRYKLIKLMAGNIKRYTQALTQKNVICSVVFGKREFMLRI